jgi:nucleoside-diphosphate-sugar epimerase
VFHLAGIAHQHASPEAYQRINVDASVALAQRAREAGVARFVFFSSTKATQTGEAATAMVEHSNRAVDYASSKRIAERELYACLDGSGTELVILRPALVYGGCERGHLALLRRWVDWHLPAPPPGGCRSMIARADLLRLALVLAEPAHATPRLLTVTDGQAYSAQRLHAALCRARGRRPWFPSPPRVLWKTACELYDRLRSPSPGTSWQRLSGEEISVQEGLDELAFSPSLSFERSLNLPS